MNDRRIGAKAHIKELADALEAVHRGAGPDMPELPTHDEDLLTALRSAIAQEDAAATRHMRVVSALLDRMGQQKSKGETTAIRQRSLAISCPAEGSSDGRFFIRNEFSDARSFAMALRWSEDDDADAPRFQLSPQEMAIASGYEIGVGYHLDLAGTNALPGSTLAGRIEVVADGHVRATIWVDVQVTSKEAAA